MPVVPHFRGILLPVVFHDALQLDISYSTKLATFVVPPADAHLDSVVVSTPFSCEQEDTMSLLTGVALPVLYGPRSGTLRWLRRLHPSNLSESYLEFGI